MKGWYPREIHRRFLGGQPEGGGRFPGSHDGGTVLKGDDLRRAGGGGSRSQAGQGETRGDNALQVSGAGHRGRLNGGRRVRQGEVPGRRTRDNPVVGGSEEASSGLGQSASIVTLLRIV